MRFVSYMSPKGDIDMARILLAHHAKVNAKAYASRGETPLHRAMEAGHKDMVWFLRLHGGYNAPIFEYGPGPYWRMVNAGWSLAHCLVIRSTKPLKVQSSG